MDDNNSKDGKLAGENKKESVKDGQNLPVEIKKVTIDGEDIIVYDPKKHKKEWLIAIPQVLYRNFIFSPVSQNQYQHKISHESSKIIHINNLCDFNLYYPVLNQTHANIIDAILYNIIQYNVNEVDNSFWAIVALNEVMDTLNISKNYLWLSKKVKEIQEAIFIAYDIDKNHKTIPTKQMPLIGWVTDFKGVVQNKYIGFSKEYAPYRAVVFSPLFAYLMNNSYVITFPRTLIPKIIELKYPINQAITRYCLGSVNVNENLEKLLIKLGVAGVVNGKLHKVLKHQYFSYIKKEQDKLLEYFNIEIKPLKNQEIGVVRRVGKGDVVRFKNTGKVISDGKKKDE